LEREHIRRKLIATNRRKPANSTLMPILLQTGDKEGRELDDEVLAELMLIVEQTHAADVQVAERARLPAARQPPAGRRSPGGRRDRTAVAAPPRRRGTSICTRRSTAPPPGGLARGRSTACSRVQPPGSVTTISYGNKQAK
jgi:hypothetical protein